MRRRRRRKQAAFQYREPTFPSDRQRCSQDFERIVPCFVQDVGEPEGEVGEDSRHVGGRSLRILHRLSTVYQGRRYLPRDLTAKDVPGVRGVERQQSLRLTSDFDHLVELGCAIARTPGQAQGSAVPKREAEARAKSDAIGAEFLALVSTGMMILRLPPSDGT